MGARVDGAFGGPRRVFAIGLTCLIIGVPSAAMAYVNFWYPGSSCSVDSLFWDNSDPGFTYHTLGVEGDPSDPYVAVANCPIPRHQAIDTTLDYLYVRRYNGTAGKSLTCTLVNGSINSNSAYEGTPISLSAGGFQGSYVAHPTNSYGTESSWTLLCSLPADSYIISYKVWEDD